jgi:hypothetical protein
MSDSKEDMSEEDMETEEALKRMAERDPAVREALIQLTDEDPEKRKEAFAKLGEALGEDFRMRPWRHMSALEMDPEVREFLKTPKVPIYTTFEWHLSYFYIFFFIGFTVFIVTDLGAFHLKWWVIIFSAIGAFEIYKLILKGKIKAMEED